MSFKFSIIMHLRNKLEGEKKHILCELAERVSFSTFELQYIYIYIFI